MDKHLPRCPCIFLTSAQAREAEISCCCGYILQTLADLRAKVEALHGRGCDSYAVLRPGTCDCMRLKVLDLIDGSSDDSRP